MPKTAIGDINHHSRTSTNFSVFRVSKYIPVAAIEETMAYEVVSGP
jgi:hypothetical protein